MPRCIAAFGFGLLAKTLGMQVIYYDIETKLALDNARAVSSLDLETADLVTLHVPETLQTHQMIGAVQLARMKKGLT
jgi:D-3-phosphoglycerate dehydrogenase